MPAQNLRQRIETLEAEAANFETAANLADDVGTREFCIGRASQLRNLAAMMRRQVTADPLRPGPQ